MTSDYIPYYNELYKGNYIDMTFENIYVATRFLKALRVYKCREDKKITDFGYDSKKILKATKIDLPNEDFKVAFRLQFVEAPIPIAPRWKIVEIGNEEEQEESPPDE